ncbi:MAG: site-2 protease family protein [Oscillospiraceae bacterium]|nr:site-2 protease family protein [Oscillospiraceae bacterium]
MLFRLFGGGDAATIIQTLIARILVLMTAIPIHEYAHAWAAEKMGDSTARYYRRLSLNPFDHIDPIGALMLLVLGFGFARPVPINSMNFKNRIAGTVVSSLAGPASNILMALLCMIVAKLLRLGFYATGFTFLVGIFKVIMFMVQVNLSLAVFNLLPLPPLDGWHAVSPFIPRQFYWEKIQPYESQLVWIVLLLVWVGALDGIISLFVMFFFNLINMMTFFI